MSSLRWVLLFAIGCSRGGEENLGLKTAPAATVDVAQLAQPAQLLRALALPGRVRDMRLGAQRFAAQSTTKIAPPGKASESLDETWTLDSDGKGALHLIHDNDRKSGMEAIVAGSQLYVRPRFGRFVSRKPEPDELERLRASAEGVSADYLSLVAHALQVREEGRTQVAGRAAVKLKLSAAPSPGSAPRESDPSRKWRESVQVRYVDGELALDTGSGALLSAKLSIAYSFEREGEKGPFLVTLSYTASTAPAEAIAAPADFVAEPRRVRPMLDRTALLEGLK
jgi:hypothetical protein